MRTIRVSGKHGASGTAFAGVEVKSMLRRSILAAVFLSAGIGCLAGCLGAEPSDTGPLIDGVEAPQRVARNSQGNYQVEPRIKFHDPNGDAVVGARISWSAIDLGRAGILTITLASSDQKANGGALLVVPFSGDLAGLVEFRIVLIDEDGREGEAITRRVVLEG